MTTLGHYWELVSCENTIAFTSPVCDLLFKKSIGYQWQGRGCCVVFRQSPLTMTKPEALGVLLHEIGHWIAQCDKPERSDFDEKRALRASWDNMETDKDHHNDRWLRATLHAWHRCCKAGYEIPLDCLGGEQHKITRPAFKRILAETITREAESIEGILSTPVGGSKRRRKRAVSSKAVSPKPRPKVHMQLIGNDILQYKGWNDDMALNGKRITQKEYQSFRHMMDDERREFYQKLNARPDFILQ